MHTMSQQHYTIRGGSEHNLVDRIAAAYRAAGLTPPNRADELRTLLEDEPTPDELAERLAVESLTVTELEPWAEDAIERVHRAHAVDTLRRALGKHRATAAKRNAPELIAAAAADLAKPFDTAAKRLTKAAGKLPADPLDLEAVIATDTTAERRAAVEALTLFAHLASMFNQRAHPDLSAQARAVLVVVDVPEVTRAHVNRLTRSIENPDPERDHIRQMLRDAERRGPDVTIIEAARGTYGERVGLALPLSGTDLHERTARAAHAAGGTLVDGTSRRSGNNPMQIHL